MGPFHGYRFEGRRYDCGDKAGFIEANIAYALKHEVIGGKVARHRCATTPSNSTDSID